MRFAIIPLFADRPSHPSVPLGRRPAGARSAGQGRPKAGASRAPFTAASTLAGWRRLGVGSAVTLAVVLLSGGAAPVAALAQDRPAARSAAVHPYAGHVAEAARRFGIPEAWIWAVMRVESGGDSRAVSHAGAMGLPETPMHLDALLADEPLTGGLEPKLGDHHLRTLTIVGFPSVTFPGLLDELNRLAFEYRWSTRAVMLDKTDATKLLSRIRRQWFAKRKSIAAILKEVMTNEASVLMDSDASNKAADADTALQELGADYAGMAYVTATVTVWDRDPAIAAEKLRLVEKVIQGRDFTVIPEGMNAIEAWLGSLAHLADTEPVNRLPRLPNAGHQTKIGAGILISHEPRRILDCAVY